MTKDTPTSIEDIARVCHEANRAWCQIHGDNSQLPWDQAPAWQRESAINGVRFSVDNENATPEQQHAAWADAKASEGWSYGPIKDAEAKTHPCLVPYDQLPIEQRQKDALFLAIVRALA